MVSGFLEEQGKAAVARQLAQQMEEPPAKPPPVTAPVTAWEIDKMGKAELRKLAKTWKVKQFKKETNDELKEDLKKHLRKQPQNQCALGL